MLVGIIREAVERFVPENNLTPDLISAAVMILVFRLDDELFVILNRRADTVEHHKGEVCFPGGTMDRGDPDLLFTALRELKEEMGISSNEVEVFGSIGSVQTNTGFNITPYVGFIRYPYQCELNKDEVESIIEFPIKSMSTGKFDRPSVSENRYPVFEYDGNIVFGATARILSDFYNLIVQPSEN